ncbi:hypothetical protein ACK8OR_06585 [Jannaschia sp. KMU-145]|uniref:hypothetical protein n=1 Tax=Jannaschia halovivens TaxID=3388667 RepID=UPI00396B1B2A
MRVHFLIAALGAVLTLSACEPPVPESGVGGAAFETPEQYAARREAQLRGTPAPIAPATTVRPPDTPVAVLGPQATTLPAPAPGTTSEAAQIASQTRAVLGAPPATSAAPAPLPGPATAAVNPGELDRDNPNISREQDFAAVSAERSIEDDAARVRAARQQYQLVQPTELQRPNDSAPNIIAYALNDAQAVGTKAFRRNPLSSNRRSEQRCAGYRTPDVAQEEFLAAGGPQSDRLNLDPDGDGNACSWNPATFRALVRQ